MNAQHILQVYEYEATCCGQHLLNLGTWVSKQRTNKNQLSEGQIARLDALGFVWKVR